MQWECVASSVGVCRQFSGVKLRLAIITHTKAQHSGAKGGLGYTKGGLVGDRSALNSDNFAHPGSPAIFLDQFKKSQVTFLTWVGPTTGHNNLQ